VAVLHFAAARVRVRSAIGDRAHTSGDTPAPSSMQPFFRAALFFAGLLLWATAAADAYKGNHGRSLRAQKKAGDAEGVVPAAAPVVSSGRVHEGRAGSTHNGSYAGAVTALASAAAGLRAELRHALPTYINATDSLLGGRGVGRLGEAGSNATRSLGATVADLERTAFELWGQVATYLMEFIHIVSDIMSGSETDGGLQLKQLTAKLQMHLVLHVLPDLIKAARGLVNSSKVTALPATSVAGPMDETETVRKLLADFAETLPTFIKHTMADWPNQPQCTLNIATVLMLLVDAVARLQFSTADCGGDGDPEALGLLDCAVDVAGLFEKFGEASSTIADAVFVCGNGDASCLQEVAGGFGDFARAAKMSIVAAADCSWPPPTPTAAFDWCAMDVLGTLESLSKSAVHIDAVIALCGSRNGTATLGALSNLEMELRGEFARVLPGVMVSMETVGVQAVNATLLTSSAAPAAGPERRLGCRGVNHNCWVDQQCCSARCSRTHRCRPVM